MCPGGPPGYPAGTVLGGRALLARTCLARTCLARTRPAVPARLAIGRTGLGRTRHGGLSWASGRHGGCAVLARWYRRERPRLGFASRAVALGGQFAAGLARQADDRGTAMRHGREFGDRARRPGGRAPLPEDFRSLLHNPGRQQERRQRTEPDGSVDNRQAASDNPRDKYRYRRGHEDGADLNHTRPPRAQAKPFRS
jgi:hypothetical protein